MESGKKYLPSLISVVSGVVFGLLFFLVNLVFNEGKDTPTTIVFGIFFGLIIDIYITSKNHPENTEKLNKIEESLNSTDKFISKLIANRNKVTEIESHLFSRKEILKDVGFKIWNDYLNSFEITESGIYLPGEELALNTSIRIWRFLSIKQSQDKNHPIIARITHSNDVSVWLPEENSISNELYIYQKNFIENGGKIIRILIGHPKQPDERYNKVMNNMKEIGIDVRYFSVEEVGEKEFDFLYLHDESFVLKWYSGMNGKNIAGCFISDLPDESIINRWATLFFKAKSNGVPITSIPKEREFSE